MSFSKRRVIMVAMALLLGGSLVAVFVEGSGGLEAASWVAAIFGLVVALTAIPHDGALDLDRTTIRRFVRTSLSVIVAAGTLLTCAGDAVSRTSLGAVFGASLMIEASGPVVVFGRDSDGVGYCSRSDRAWSNRWHGPNISRDWRRLDDLTAFTSTYQGLEVVGRRGHRLVFGYRDPQLVWQPLKRIGEGVIGKPAALQDTATPGGQRFLAFAPSRSGGIKVFERADYKAEPWPHPWLERSALARELGRVDGVAASQDREGNMVLLIRTGTRLREMHRSVAPLDQAITNGWSKRRLLQADLAPEATGNPTHTVVDDDSDTVRFVVPTAAGIALLSTPDGGRRWQSEKISLPSSPTAVAQLTTIDEEGDRTSVVVFVRNRTLEQIWRDENSPWSAPEPLTC